MSDALFTALDKVEAEKAEFIRQIEEADQGIKAATVQRPTAAQVQEGWENIGRVWPVLTEEEKTDLLVSVVQSVEVTEKEALTLDLIPWSAPLMSSAQVYSERFGLYTPFGSGELVWC